MIIIALLILLFQPPTVAESLRAHLSQILKLKCESLPRHYVDDKCYFAVFEEAGVEESNVTQRCSYILSAAKAVLDIPKAIFEQMVVEKSKFQLGSDSKFKNFMCAYETGYRCDAQGAILKSGRCFIRAPKQMNFANANNFCRDRGMEIPAPATDFENQIVRDVLVKGPVWAQKSLVQANGFNWSPVSDYSKWTTCNRDTAEPRLYAGSYNSLVSCKQDRASAIDKDGHWSKCAVNDLMDLVCVVDAENDFTTAIAPTTTSTTMATTTTRVPCNYHGSSNTQPMLRSSVYLCRPGVESNICYTYNQTSIRYNFMAKSTVHTQRGCELLCESRAKCTGFSFKDAGFSSECVILGEATNQTCEATIYLKKTVGCGARTNITAEFGNDPCIDDAVDCNGRRLTLDTYGGATAKPSGNMWMFTHKTLSVAIVAATCALAEGANQPLPNLYGATPNRVNPCNSGGYLYTHFVDDDWKGKTWFGIALTATTSITCKAGMWVMWREKDRVTYGVTALSCQQCWWHEDYGSGWCQ